MSELRCFPAFTACAVRGARARRAIVFATAVAFLALSGAALTHHHKSRRAELLCPACQFVGHSQIAIPTPDPTPITTAVVVLLLAAAGVSIELLLRCLRLTPHIRAPPLPAC